MKYKVTYENLVKLRLARKEVEASICAATEMQNKLKYGRKFNYTEVFNSMTKETSRRRLYVGMSEDRAQRHLYLELLKRHDLRRTMRHLNLVWAFLRGVDYKKVENNAKTRPSLAMLSELITVYGAPELMNSTQESRLHLLAGWLESRTVH